jgi:hypothetical protein
MKTVEESITEGNKSTKGHVRRKMGIEMATDCVCILYKNLSNFCVISGFRREVGENCVLLGYYIASSDRGLKTGPTGCPKATNSTRCVIAQSSAQLLHKLCL